MKDEKIFANEILSEVQLENVSGGTYKDYILVTNAIVEKMRELNPGKKITRLPESDAVSWLRNNINVSSEFNASNAFDFLNSSAKYHGADGKQAGITYTQKEVIDMIKKWKPDA